MKGICLCFCLVAWALSSTAGAAPLFEDQATLAVSFSGPIRDLMSGSDADQLPDFTLEAGGVSYSVRARLEDRGRIKVCRFAPLIIEFEAGAASVGPFAGQDSLTMVMPCRDNDRADQDVVDELAAYRLFGLFSDVSFRARLLSVQFEDTSGRRAKAFDGYAAVIESPRELAERLGAELVSTKTVSHADLNQKQALIVYVFQYFISNTDWSLAPARMDADCCHNGVLLDAGDGLLYVPRDFDMSGIVNPPSARPNRLLGQYRTTQRVYRGYCAPLSEFGPVLTEFAAREHDVIKLVTSLPAPSTSQAAKTMAFLLQYYDTANHHDPMLRHFEQLCR